MRKTRVVGLNAAKLVETMMKTVVDEQNKRLIAYAQDEIIKLGAAINSLPTKNNMDDKGNLLDSLCWGVCYSGNLVGSGFYRAQVATMPSELHAYSTLAVLEGGARRKWKDLYNADIQKARSLQESNFSYTTASEPVNGHALAQDFIDKFAKKSKEGQWTVFFAILAPYWGYWEQGHNNRLARRFLRFQVMTEFFDQVKQDLKPAKTRLKIHVEKYASKSLYSSAKKNLKNPQRFDEW